MVDCPLCNAVIDVDEDELDEGDSLTCEECGATLTVTGVDPLEIVPAEEQEDDEEEEEDDEDFDYDEDEDSEEEEEDEEDWK